MNFLAFFLIFISGVVYAQFFYDWPKTSVNGGVTSFEIAVIVLFIIVLFIIGLVQEKLKQDQFPYDKNRLTDEEKSNKE